MYKESTTLLGALLQKEIDGMWIGTILFNDVDIELPITKIWLNAIGKARKSGIQGRKHERLFQFIIFYHIIWGRIKYFFSKKVILTGEHEKYWKPGEP